MSGVLKGVSIRGLEVFEALAQTGSVGEAARRLGMSAPAVSQQLKNLNQAVGIPLIDQGRRPMTLTPGGRQFLRHVEAALGALRAGQRDLTTLDLSDVSSLRIGVIEDFENEVTPALTVRLAETMENCVFRLQTGASHVLLSQVAHTELDIAICAEGREVPPGAAIHPLLEDPYILAVPKGTSLSGGLASLGDLRFLRRDQAQVMGQQIEDGADPAGPVAGRPVRAGQQPVDLGPRRGRACLDHHHPAQPAAGGALPWRDRRPPAALRRHGAAHRAVRQQRLDRRHPAPDRRKRARPDRASLHPSGAGADAVAEGPFRDPARSVTAGRFHAAAGTPHRAHDHACRETRPS